MATLRGLGGPACLGGLAGLGGLGGLAPINSPAVDAL